MVRPVTIVMLLALFWLTACGGVGVASNEVITAPAMGAMPEARSERATAIESAGSAAGGAASGESSTQAQYGLRMVIMNASLVVEVASVDQAEAQLRNSVNRLGGYTLYARATGEGENKTSYVTFRVPVEHFDRFLTDVEGIAERVIRREVRGEDVTEEYVDLEARLRNLEASRDRIAALLARANTVEETLRINQALTEIQGQIEHLQGRMRYLEQNAAYSTIDIELRPLPPAPEPSQTIWPTWEPGKVWSEQLALLATFGYTLLNALIVIVVWTPVWIIPAFLVVWLWRHWQRGRQSEQVRS